jgi:dolichol-phosphate mannosyltransferase
MIAIWQNGNADVVEGVKSSRGKESFSTKLNALLFYKIFSKASGYELKNASDFKLLDKQVVDEWKKLGEHDTFFRALSAWLGFRRKTFEFDVPPRKTGESKWSVIHLAKLSINAITSFSALPLYMITLMGFASLFFSFIIGIQTIVKWAMGTAATGFTTVILLLLLIGGLIMISLGLIGIYIARIYTEVKGRPRYIISRHTKSTREN